MALSRELLRRLDADEEPLPKRLKLAENAFCSIDLPIFQKEDLILRWLCGVSEMDPNVWQTLKHCLERLDVNTETTVKLEVKEILVNTLLNKFNNDGQAISDEALKCCNWIFLNTEMQQYFKNKPKQFALLLKSVSNFTSMSTECSSIDVNLDGRSNGTGDAISWEDSKVRMIYNCMISAAESIVQIYKLSLDKDKLTVIFLNDILYPLCALVDRKCIDSTNRLGAEVHKCIQQLVFGKSKYAQYKEYKKEDENSIPAELFSTLARHTDTMNLENNIVSFVCVFRAAVGSYKTDSAVLDLIFRNLIDSAGQFKKEILYSFFEYLTDITLEFNNDIGGITLTAFFHEIIDEILLCKHFNHTNYQVLCGIADLNPLIIENKLPEILQIVLLKEKTTEFEEVSYAKLMISILDASIRLRREQKLVPWLLMALKQSLAKKKRKTKKKDIGMIFPTSFREKFTESVGNMTSPQIVAILRSLTFHLNKDCIEAIEVNSSNENFLMMEATVELLVAFFNGVRIYEYSVTLASQQKFVNAHVDLGNVLSIFAEKIFSMKHDERMSTILLSAMLSWSQVQSLLIYYAPKSISNDLIFPIPADQWQRLVERITNFGERSCKIAMNKLVLHRLKTPTAHEPLVKLNGLIDGLTYSWSLILEYNPEVILLLDDKQTSEVASLVLADMGTCKSNFQKWMNVLSWDNIQENKCLVIALLCQVFVHIGQVVTPSVTRSIMECINAVEIVEAEVNGSSKTLEVLERIKIKLAERKWTCIENENCYNIKRYLKILLHLPLMYLGSNVRILIFMAAYAIGKECSQDKKTVDSCNKICLDVLEEGGLDIFQYIDPILLVDQLPQSNVLSKVFELSLRNVTSYTVLKRLITTEQCATDSMPTLLACVEKIKPKLNSHQKIIFRKAEKKLSRIILDGLDEEIKDAEKVRYLTLVLKAAIANKRIKEKLERLVKSTLDYIFVFNNLKEECRHSDELQSRDTLIQEGLQLSTVVLRHRTILKFQGEEIIRHIWPVMLKRPKKDLLTPLLEASASKVFHRLLTSLHSQTIKGLQEENGVSLENALIIWDYIVKADMGAVRNKLRSAAICNLFQSLQISDIPEKRWLDILQLLRCIVASKHMPISDENIDVIMFIVMRSLREAKSLVCNEVLAFCLALLRLRTSLITDRLPALLLLFRQVSKLVVFESKKSSCTFDEHQLRSLALNIEKFTSALIKLKRDMVRIGPYVIADLVELFTEGAIPSCVKESLENSVGHLLSICDQHAVALLSRALSPAMHEIFKGLYNTYNKFYKFIGKI